MFLFRGLRGIILNCPPSCVPARPGGLAVGAALVAHGLALALSCQSSTREAAGAFFFVDQVPVAPGSFQRGDLPQLREQGFFSSSVILANETRRALTPSLPAKLTFAVEIPPRPVLQFAIAMATLGRPEQRSLAKFRITVNAGEGDRTCFEQTLLRHQRNQWLEREVDLTPWAGSKAQISFEVTKEDRSSESGEEALFPLWGNPVLNGGDGHNRRANLVLISVDCLRPDHLGTYGYERETTPRIDAFAEEAMVFETAVSTSSWTLPTHLSMLTGLPPSLHGGTRRTRKPARSVPYLPDLLARAGYQVDGVVTGAFLFPKFGFERGFHTYRTFDDSRAAVTVDAAIDLLRRSEGRAQFLFVHLFDPHFPYRPPAEFVEHFNRTPPDISRVNLQVEKGEVPETPETKDVVIGLYDAEIAYLDQEFGRFMDALKTRGLYERSLILLTADHGEALYEHEAWRHTYTLYDEIIRVPLIVKWPGRSPRGRVKVQVSQVDIFPTLLEEAGLEPPHSSGVNLRRYLDRSEKTPLSPLATSEVIIPVENSPVMTMKVSFRTEDFKYIATLEGPNWSEPDTLEIIDEELYRLAADPHEQSNVAQSFSRETERFRKRLRAYLQEATRIGAGRKGETIELDEELRERLRVLGYIH